MTAQQPDLALFPPFWDRWSTGGKKKEVFQQLSLCFGCEKSSWRVTLKSVLACDILGYTQVHSESVTPCHFLPRLGDSSSGEVSQLPDLWTFWLMKVIRTVQKRTHEDGRKNVNGIAHIHLWKRRWIAYQARSSQWSSHTPDASVGNRVFYEGTNRPHTHEYKWREAINMSRNGNMRTRCHQRLHMHDPTWQHKCFVWQVRLKINLYGNISQRWHKGLQCYPAGHY